jgi:hypothetical protein
MRASYGAQPIRVDTVRVMLRAVERVLFRGDVMAGARRNAWDAVCDDRQRAADRAEAWRLLGGAPGSLSGTAPVGVVGSDGYHQEGSATYPAVHGA